MRFVGVDPSTKLGLVILDEAGQVVFEKEIKTTEKQDPQRFIALSESVLLHLQPDDKIMIEGFSYGSKGAGVSTQYGVGWQIRADLVRRGFTYTEVTPSGLKKFASGKGNTKKDNLVIPIFKKWSYESDSDNIRDAYVLARIGMAQEGLEKLTAYQEDVIKALKGA